MASSIDWKDDVGRMANNYVLVQGLYASLKRAETNSGLIPRQIARIIKEDSWRAWLNPESDVRGGEGFGDAADFREFISKPWPQGCGSSVSLIERLIIKTDAWLPYCQVIGGSQGGENNPYGRAGKPDEEINTDNIRIDSSARDIIPLPRRDRSNDMPGGTSRIANIRRLMKETEAGKIDPEILELVKKGSLSPHQAMVRAGFRDESITIPNDPLKASRRLLKYFQDDRLRQLLEELANHAGFTLTPRT